ncbi:MAG: hypothetical protein IKV87_06460 [Methanobrevibacter sp.]|nr:hypothetical protein [Methanobrevibacter sp.]
MTSPCHSITNFHGKITLPSNPEHKLKISIPIIQDDYWDSTCNIREIRLLKEDNNESYIEETPLVPFRIFEHLGDFNDDKIIKEFREDEIEFI